MSVAGARILTKPAMTGHVLVKVLKVLLLCTPWSFSNGNNGVREGVEGTSAQREDGLAPVANDAIVACYYSYGDALDPALCTHLMVFGATINADGTIVFLNTTAAKIVLGFKVKNPSLKILVTVGGDCRNVMSDPVKMNRVTDQIVEFIQKSKFDGFDLDWEILSLFPFKPPYKGMDAFFRMLREKFDKEPRQLYLTAAVFAAPLDLLHPSYNVTALNESLDFINLMAYDFYQYLPTQPYTGHNAPLFKRPEEFWIFGRLNTAWAALNWYKHGMHHKKIAVGVPTYGHTYTLLFRFWHSLRAPATGFGLLGRFVTYRQVCNLLVNESYTRVWDNYAKVPYCYKDKQWISYDDSESVAAKADWIKQQGFGGAMIYDFHNDDPLGECDGSTTFPLHRKVWSILKG